MCDPAKPETSRRKKPAGFLAIFALIGATALAACQSFEPRGGVLIAEVDAPSAIVALQRVNERGHQCWIRSGDRAFRSYQLVPELDTRAGDPRILVMARGDTQGLPQLVISAAGDPVSLTTFGPLAEHRLSRRINSDILAWSAGRQSCT